MFALKRFVRLPGAVIALAAACFSTGAHAGWDGNGWGVGPNNNGWGIGGPTNNGFRGPIDNGPRAGAVGTFRGVGSRQNFGFNPYDGWGMGPQQNVGFGPFAQSLGFNPQYGFGFPGSSFGPISFGMVNPWGGWGMGSPQGSGTWVSSPWAGYGLNSPWPTPQGVPQVMGLPFNPPMGMYPQQGVGFVNPWMGMSPYAQMPMQAASSQQQGGLQGVQCTINGVGVLTKDADDCEKAGGEVAKAKTANQ